MSIPILLAALSLVLIGLLFGFNIQTSQSFISLLSTIGTLVSAVAAAIAAYFSYKSVGQWRNEAEHKLLYDHFNELENLLTTYINKVKEQVYNDSDTFVSFYAASSSASEISDDYESVYLKIYELAPKTMHPGLDTLQLSSLVSELTEPIMKYKSSRFALNKYVEDNPLKTEQMMMSEIPEMRESGKKMMKAGLEIELIFSETRKSLSSLRASL